MEKLWAGLTGGKTDRIADDFNSSLRFDRRMYAVDIRGSMAHAAMLGAQGIVKPAEADALIDGLGGILDDLSSGKLAFDETAEDIHMFVEQELTKRLGDTGKKLHTARSRNDQVALDLRMYLADETEEIERLVAALLEAIAEQAETHMGAIMPGYTHLQRAQPILFSHHLLAYAAMLTRDLSRLSDCKRRTLVSPIGCCALAGTTYKTDRRFEAERLGFPEIAGNSMDGVSDRDFCLELLSCLAILMMHLSRFSEELILWSSHEFRFIRMSDAFTTGSSIMPQKKNPDMAELVRGKTGRVYGDLVALLTTMKGLPLAYNKDMQEDKEAVFDAVDTVKLCLRVFAPMLQTMEVLEGNMQKAAESGFLNSTDFADYLVGKGLPFRSAYQLAGRAVAICIEKGCTLETLPLEAYRAICPEVAADVYRAVDLAACVARRTSEGGTAQAEVEKQLDELHKRLHKQKGKQS